MKTNFSRYRGLTLIFLVALAITGCSRSPVTTLESPDQNVMLHLTLDPDGRLLYNVSYKDKSFILPSSLGLELNDRPSFKSGFTIVSTKRATVDSTWKPVYGISDRARNHYNELAVKLREQQEPRRILVLRFRAYNNGLAFRYEIPQQDNLGEITIRSEETTFRFADNYSGFVMKRPGFDGNYEGYYLERALSDIGPDTLAAMPLLLKLDNGWAALTEANLTQYAGMSLKGVSREPYTLLAALAPLPDRDPAEGKTTTAIPFRTPWRTIMLGDRAGDLTVSNLIQNLNAPNNIDDPSFIRPGQVIWPWWNGRIADDLKYSGEPSTQVMKYYIDFAAENGIPALLVDAGWYSMEGEAWSSPEEQDLLTMEETRANYYDIREIIDYGNRLGVDIHLWVHMVSLLGREETVLSAYSDWGVAGIKVDSYGGDHRRLVDDIQQIAKVAAKHRLVMNYHGAYKPTGWERTYPNFMTREGVYGLEQSRWSPTPSPTHNVTIPYTRMLAGAMDYTPGAFDLDGTEAHPKQVQTTRAHQVAMYIVYYSPLQMLVDYPGAYRRYPDMFRFVLDIPATWDESVFLDGTPSDYIIMARRNGERWYIGAMTNEQGRLVSIPLDFLKDETSYRARILSDGSDAGPFMMETKTFSPDDTLKVSLASTGGAAVILAPEH